MHDDLYEQARVIADASFIKHNFLYPKSLSVRYALYRVLRPLLKVRYKLFRAKRKVTPWTSPASILIFEKVLTREMTGFEYGSGNSTLFFAPRVKHLISIEHNSNWYEYVHNALQKDKIINVDYHLLPPDQHPHDHSYSFYEEYRSLPSNFHVMREYHEYFSFIRNFSDNSFDFVLVDGRARVECVMMALAKIKSGGMLVLDNSERKRYKPVFEILKPWRMIHTTNGLTDTTFWFKP